MSKYLVIVESPAKVKTIKKFLGPSYDVAASMGHVRDLPKSKLGIDLEHDYEPQYITIRGKGELLANLRRQVKKADKVYLATDPDREGEAISWHLSKALNIPEKEIHRITFNEITKSAVKESLKHSRGIDMDLVDAQQARRILDRMVGYEISPVLWAKVKRGLSAGRVQSVALRIIADREAQIAAFIPEEYWTLDSEFSVEGSKKTVSASFYGDENGKIAISNEKQAKEIEENIKKGPVSVQEVKKGSRMRKAPLPFTTSTLQQEAGKVLNFATQKTMRIAQQLYEGVEIKGAGTVGLISYLRTDSTRVSDEAMNMAVNYIKDNFAPEYLAEAKEKKVSQGKIQDAHECIRPTDLSLEPSAIKASLSRDQFRLYQLIYKRFLASCMSSAKYETVSVKIKAGSYIFTAASSKLSFDGFLKVYVPDEEKDEAGSLSVDLTQDSRLSLKDTESKKHFTQPPAHFTEASLVKALEEMGIGRPSTYAPTITTILARRYVTKENKNLYITEIGDIVNNIMKEAFPSIVDVNFTVNFETLLDGVEEGNVNWKSVIENFYPDLHDAVKKAEEEIEKTQIQDEVTDEICENCGRNMVIKYGPHGKFLACPGFPECRNTRPYFEKTGALCPKCKSDIVIRNTKKGRRYYGCMGFPECDFMSWNRPSKTPCPKCGSLLVYKGSRLTCTSQDCDYIGGEKDKDE
ncbi:MAG: type I DNA topoisomerase [Lachnospiraceae bacterium]|nr:type I DNA topoisomerase [Lachnospiraceae bacterium]